MGAMDKNKMIMDENRKDRLQCLEGRIRDNRYVSDSDWIPGVADPDPANRNLKKPDPDPDPTGSH